MHQVFIPAPFTVGNVPEKPGINFRAMGFYEVVPVSGKMQDRMEIQVFQVEQPAPDHHGRGLACAAAEIALIDQQDLIAPGAEPVINRGAVDACTDDDGIKLFVVGELLVFLANIH